MRKTKCFCGCGRAHGLQVHHVIYQQELRRIARTRNAGNGPAEMGLELILCADPRNMVPVGPDCHAAHHDRSDPYKLTDLPDAAYEFAVEQMGTGAAYEYLRRRYRGPDPRLQKIIQKGM